MCLCRKYRFNEFSKIEDKSRPPLPETELSTDVEIGDVRSRGVSVAAPGGQWRPGDDEIAANPDLTLSSSDGQSSQTTQGIFVSYFQIDVVINSASHH